MTMQEPLGGNLPMVGNTDIGIYKFTPLSKKMANKGIVINRMYVGDYLSSNLGHEIINLFLADNGCHYLYLNANGSFERKHKDRINYMLMVKYEPKDCFEVIGLAKGLKQATGVELRRKRDIGYFEDKIFECQKEFIKSQPEGDVRYGGFSILDIFNQAEQQSVFITYKADEVLTPKDDYRIFLHYDANATFSKDGNEIHIPITNHNLPKTSLKSYIYSNDEGSDYSTIVNYLIDNEEIWKKDPIKKVDVAGKGSEKEITLFEICQIQNDENRLSNALAYFMSVPAYFSLWKDFFHKYGINLKMPIVVEREVTATVPEDKQDKAILTSGGRIDILLKDDENIIVIENKIKSDINRVKTDSEGTDQLDRYRVYCNWLGDKMNIPQHQRYLFIMAPDYQVPNLKRKDTKGFTIITYGDLHSHLMDSKYTEHFQMDRNFKAFRDVIVRHTHSSANAYLYDEMMEKFNSRINQLKQ